MQHSCALKQQLSALLVRQPGSNRHRRRQPHARGQITCLAGKSEVTSYVAGARKQIVQHDDSCFDDESWSKADESSDQRHTSQHRSSNIAKSCERPVSRCSASRLPRSACGSGASRFRHPTRNSSCARPCTVQVDLQNGLQMLMTFDESTTK